MVILNFSNVEEHIFYNSKIHQILPPHFSGIFEQWKVGKQFPFLSNLSKQALLDFLNTVNSGDLELLSEFFNQRVEVERMNYNIVTNLTIPLEEEKICEKLYEIVGFNYYSTWRDSENIYLTFWR